MRFPIQRAGRYTTSSDDLADGVKYKFGIMTKIPSLRTPFKTYARTFQGAQLDISVSSLMMLMFVKLASYITG